MGTVITNVVGGVLEGARCGVKFRKLFTLVACDNLQDNSKRFYAMGHYAILL